jgi:hypothetical protein
MSFRPTRKPRLLYRLSEELLSPLAERRLRVVPGPAADDTLIDAPSTHGEPSCGAPHSFRDSNPWSTARRCRAYDGTQTG